MTGDFVFYELRLPRLLVGALVGATLSISGAAFQAVFNNALYLSLVLDDQDHRQF